MRFVAFNPRCEMLSPIDLEAWKQALADRQTAEAAQRRFEQHRFNLAEQERIAAAVSVRYQAEQVVSRLQPLRAAAENRRAQLENRLAALREQQENLLARAARGAGSAARINDANRVLQSQISDCAVQINVIARLLNAKHPDEIEALEDDEIASLSLPMDTPKWTGPAGIALPRVMAGAGIMAAIAVFLPWFVAPGHVDAVSLWTGIAQGATALPAHVLGYLGVVVPVLLVIVALTALRYRAWLVIAASLSVLFVWMSAGYLRITSAVPWWSLSEALSAMRIGAWLYLAAALVGLIAACYYAQGEGNTLQRSLRTAGWLVLLFVLPGLLAAGLLSLRPGPPPVMVQVSSVDAHPEVLQLTVQNNTASTMEVSLPWSHDTHYGIRVEIKLPGAEMFRRIEDTGDCWRSPSNAERVLNRLPVAPSVGESVWFDIGCIRAMGYAPERLRFSLTNADGHTVKAYQAIIPQ